MNITNGKIENFLTIGEANLSLKDKGLVLIQGDNKEDPSADSNGAGKSTIPDALCWALYGETARGAKGDGVVNRTAKKNCSVEVTVEDDGTIYTVTRYRKHSTGKNRLVVHCDGHNVTKGTDKLTQESVNQFMGCSLEVFRAAVYAGQEAMPDLPGMTDKALKVLVEESAGIDKLQEAHTIALSKHREAEKSLVARQGILEGRKAKLIDFDTSYDLLASKKERADEERDEKIAVMTVRTKGEIAEAKLLQDGYSETEEAKLENDLLDVKSDIDGVGKEKEEEAEFVRLISVVEKSEATFLAELSAKRLTHIRSEKALAKIDDKVGTPCDECGKEHTAEDLDELRVIATAKLEEASKQYEEVVLKHSEVTEACESASKALEEFRARMTDISKSVALEREISSKLSDIFKLKNAIKVKKARAKDMVEQIKDLKTDVNPFIALMEENLNERKVVETEIDGISEEVKVLGAKARLTGDAADVFGQKGVRAHILDSVTPFLNEKTAHYLGTLSDGNISAVWSTLTTTTKGEIREKFNIEVSSETGADSFIGLSGGEKRKVRLASAMALQDMVASRATKPINLFIADEVDHALDNAGLERLMTLLDEKSREKGTVLVISHNELSDWIREQATVTKDGGYATVSGALS